MERSNGDEAVGARIASSVNVVRELVRSNTVPQLEGWATGLSRVLGRDGVHGGCVSIRQMDHLVATGEGADLGKLALEDFVQVVEYDPVRHVALVIGMRDAPRAVPLLWLLHRVYPGAEGFAVLPGHSRERVHRLARAPRWSFAEAMATAEALRGRGARALVGPAWATFERVGTVVVVPPGQDPTSVLALSDGEVSDQVPEDIR